ncbi:MAG: NADH-quinone oxidoreductase subunit H [Candidatus Obscuribacterales bacterium]|nr:NADH-quinone oxidoreductase subunit H [Candidatus Obscuribacterales bacterium]
MIAALLAWLPYILSLVIAPPLLLGLIRKIKARLQNRIGASILQPLFDLAKLVNKGETVSSVTTWIFRSSVSMNLALLILIALTTPCLPYKPVSEGGDVFLVIYLFAFARFMVVLSALDAGSAFGGFGASREVTLSFLIEPAIILALVSLGVVCRSSDLSVIFSAGNHALVSHPVLCVTAGLSLFLASLVELSRMPIDDPTTHLELTMVHEAMILENSGRNLAFVEYAHQLKMFILLAISAQCFLAASDTVWQWGWLYGIVSLALVFVLGSIIALLEATSVKLRWTRIPEFIAYPVAMSLLCVLMVIGRGP